LHGAAQGLEYLHGASIAHGDLKGVSILSFRDRIHFDVLQENILISNDAPHRACLADYGFATIITDPVWPMACGAQLDGSTMAFMSPELIAPAMFRMTGSVPTPEADVYAFGSVTFQVCEQDLGCWPLFNLCRYLRVKYLSVAFS